MPLPHNYLFHARVVRRELAAYAFPDDLANRHAKFILPWIKRLRAGDLDDSKEISLHGEFLGGVFGSALGYLTWAGSGEGEWNVTAERTVSKSGKSADGALGFFRSKREGDIVAPIELKGAKQSLDIALGRQLTPVQQAWEYADVSPGCRWIIVSNYRELRLYSRLRTPDEYEVFLLEELEDLQAFKRLFLLLSRDRFLPRTVADRAPLDDMLVASDKVQAEITAELYREYRDLRRALFTHLGQVHSNEKPLDLLKHTQIILDRILFIAFAEDRGLLPSTTLSDTIAHRDKYNPRPIWQNLVSVFRWLDQGNAEQNVPGYNGGLFAPNVAIDELELSDEMCKKLVGITRFDFCDDVSVEVLGHIFEQSITDLEEMRAEAGGEALPRISKRKAEGVYYTPSYITRYIVEETLGRVLEEKWNEAFAPESPEAEKRKVARERKEIAAWERYRDMLKETRVIDPACGSGAFLVAAFDVLAREYERVNAALAALRGGQTGLFDLTKTILNSNLFGVDLNEESVAITKLSLWLKTCSRGSKLTYLDRNIKCGDSIVSDPMARPRDDERAPRAFDWATGNLVRSFIAPATSAEDEEIDARWRSGFDAVIGNPPYVRQELLGGIKPHLQKIYRSYHGMADLFVYFFERGISLLRPSGRLGYIASNSWLRANYGTQLRAYFRTQATIEAIVDLGDNRVFADAPDVYPAIVIIRFGAPADGHQAKFASFSRGEEITEFAKQLDKKWTAVAIHDQSDSGWQLASHSLRRTLHALLGRGTPLGARAGTTYYGIKTGLNEAFVIEQNVRDAIVSADPSSGDFIKKMLRGEDLRPWYQEDEGNWLIRIPSGWTRENLDCHDEPSAWKSFRDKHRALATHLELFAEAARKRNDRGEFWWELRPCAYYEKFDAPKIFWVEITKNPRFSWDTEGKYANNKAYFIPQADIAWLATLQSRVTWFAISQLCTPLGERAGSFRYQLFAQFIERLPIPDMTSGERGILAQFAGEITAAAKSRYALHTKMLGRMGDLIPKGKPINRKLTEWWSLDFAALRAELGKTFKQDIPLRDRDDWESLWKERCAEHERLTAIIIARETEMNDRVYRLFELGKDDIRLIEEETKYPYGAV